MRVGWNSEILAVLRRAGLVELGDLPPMQPLSGGVSSDIWRVDIAGRRYCVKRALAKLKVAADWRAPIERNNYEAAYLRVVDRLVPGAVPSLVHADRCAAALVTRYLDPKAYPLWKAELMAGRVDLAVARAVGDRLGRIHSRTAGDPAIAEAFKSDAIFNAIRLEPYLLATAEAQPMVASAFRGLARRTASTKRALVHGDVSPKNIVVGALGPVFLDAECAWYGDPAFDVAFVLNHLCLKACYRPAFAPALAEAFTSLAQSYLGHVDWEAADGLEARVASLLPALMLARIDGKSPVEYLTTGKQKADVRAFAIHHLTEPPTRLAAIREAWFGGLDLTAGAAMRIAGIIGRQVYDSRGRPTVEAEVRLEDGTTGRAIAPAGASKGSAEAVDRRDGGAAFGGYGVATALAGIATRIAPALRGLDVADQPSLDAALVALDGTANRAALGANAMIAVSMAAAHAAAASRGLPLWRHLLGEPAGPVTLPLPEIQIFGGGAHAAGRLDIQDFMVVCPGASSVAEALAWTAEIYRAAGSLMAESGRLAGVADEGGWWPVFDGNEAALEVLVRAIERAGRRPSEEVAISLDVAASEFGRAGRYRLAADAVELDREGWFDRLAAWVDRWPIVSIEDPFAEDDAAGFLRFTRSFGHRLQVVGDDFLVTDAERVRAAGQSGTANAVLLKPNQRGTLTETLAAWTTARAYGMGGIVSARSGETEDTTICALAVGWQVPQLKVGSFSRSERMAKWNELLRIEEALGDRARFAGRQPYTSLPPPPVSESMSA